MDDYKRVIQWAGRWADQLNLEVTEYTWARDLGFSIYDFSVCIKVGERECYGRATEFNSDLALVKALSEAIERAVFFSSEFQNTNGFASHLSLEKAKSKALCELIERDAFLCHYLTNTPFLRRLNIADLAPDWWPIIKVFLEKGVELELMLMNSNEPLNAVCCLFNGKAAEASFGMGIGAGCSADLGTAATSAVREVIRQLAGIIYNENDPARTNLSENHQNKFKFNRQIYRHIQFGLELSNFEKMSFLFTPLNAESFIECEQQEYYSKETISPKLNPQFMTFDVNQILLTEDCPFFVVKAECQELQNLYFGETRPELVHLDRLSIFKNRNLEFKDLNQIFHPFG